MFTTKSEIKNNSSPVSRACSNCGSLVGSSDLFCHSCGSKLALPLTPKVGSSSRVQDYRGYIQLIGVVAIVFGIFALFIGLILVLVVPLLEYALQYEPEASVPPEVLPFLSTLLVGIAVVCFVYAFVSILSGKRLMQ